MRFSAHILAAALSATAAVAAPYTWSVTNWSANAETSSFQISGPATEHNGVSIPAFSLSAPCEVKGTDSVDCSSLIENNTGGQTFKAQLVTIDPENFVTISGSFGFTAGGTSHSLVTWITGKENGPASFSASGFSFDGVNGSNITLS